MNVALFIVDAKFVIPINELNAHVVSAFTGHLIFVNQIIHLLLKRIDNEVELVSLVDLLTNNIFLGFVNGNSLIEVSSQLITEVDFLLKKMLNINK